MNGLSATLDGATVYHRLPVLSEFATSVSLLPLPSRKFGGIRLKCRWRGTCNKKGFWLRGFRPPIPRRHRLPMSLAMMRETKPSNVEGLAVVVVMSFRLGCAADLARKVGEITALNRIRDCVSSGVLFGMFGLHAFGSFVTLASAVWQSVPTTVVGMTSANRRLVVPANIDLRTLFAFVESAVGHARVSVKLS